MTGAIMASQQEVSIVIENQEPAPIVRLPLAADCGDTVRSRPRSVDSFAQSARQGSRLEFRRGLALILPGADSADVNPSSPDPLSIVKRPDGPPPFPSPAGGVNVTTRHIKRIRGSGASPQNNLMDPKPLASSAPREKWFASSGAKPARATLLQQSTAEVRSRRPESRPFMHRWSVLPRFSPRAGICPRGRCVLTACSRKHGYKTFSTSSRHRNDNERVGDKNRERRSREAAAHHVPLRNSLTPRFPDGKNPPDA